MTVLSLIRFHCCSKCGCTKPATLSFFYSARSTITGLTGRCKTCIKLYSGQRYHRTKTLKDRGYVYAEDGATLVARPCTKCGETRPAAAFYARREGIGYQSRCKDCTSPEAVARMALWVQANPEAAKENQENYRERNRDDIRRRGREWNRRNREQLRVAWHRYHARLLNAEGSHTPEEIAQMYEDQNGLCAYCEIPLFGNFQVDHMLALSRGGRNDWTNLAIVCPPCNQGKRDRPLIGFMDRVRSRMRNM